MANTAKIFATKRVTANLKPKDPDSKISNGIRMLALAPRKIKTFDILLPFFQKNSTDRLKGHTLAQP